MAMRSLEQKERYLETYPFQRQARYPACILHPKLVASGTKATAQDKNNFHSTFDAPDHASRCKTLQTAYRSTRKAYVTD